MNLQHPDGNKQALWEGGLLPKGVRVKEVLDRWFGPDYSYVKVMDHSGGVYILRKGATELRWRVVFYEAPGFWRQRCSLHPIT